jgi:Fe-S cluster assembly iron-binding protein IscA
MIEISLAAQNKLRNCLGENPGKSPRISFSEGGITGPTLKLSFEEPQKGDIVEDVEDFHMIISEDVSYFAQKMSVDYVHQGADGKFEIEAKTSLGCNEDCANCQGCEV